MVPSTSASMHMVAAEASGSGTVSPPQYTFASRHQELFPTSHSDQAHEPRDDFFDIVPQPDQTSFQVGYLGLDGFQAWIKGEVLIKLDERTRAHRHLFQRCSITLNAVEEDDEQSIVLFSATQVLWENGAAPVSSHQRQQSGVSRSPETSQPDSPPNTLPFSVPLTNDLPHCIHLPHSSLRYILVATLESSDSSAMPNATRRVPVHLTRYSRPVELSEGNIQKAGKATESALGADGSLEPYRWSVESPTPMFLQLQRTLFRRAEPIDVHIRIPPPINRQTLGIGLRSIEANLIRVITNRRTNAKHELLLAHSGKLCRLHSTRTIVLRLALHPPFDASNMPYPHPDHDAAQGGPIHGRGGGGGCESITQETLLHDIVFIVNIRVAIRGEDGDRRDVFLETPVTILPGAAGVNGRDGDEVPKVNERTTRQGDTKAKEAASAGVAGPSTSYIHNIDDSEEEYDGYEDVGRPLTLSDDGEDVSIEMLLRNNNEDVPPPTLQESQNDLQVEVDVEGVGAGVLRDPTSAPALPGGYTWRSDEVAPGSSEDDVLQHSSPSDADLGYQREDSPPSFQVVTDDRNSSLRGGVDFPPRPAHDGAITTSAQGPPPYMVEAQRVPRSAHGSTDLSPPELPMAPSFAASSQGLRDHHDPLQPSVSPDRQAHGSTSGHIAEEEAFPPAYPHPTPTHFSAAFPPSYEA